MANEYNRENMIEAVEQHAKGHIAKHTMNVEVYLKNAAGVGEHPDILEAIEKEFNLSGGEFTPKILSHIYLW